jgi:hypothetical protein
MAIREADIFKVVVLAAGAHTFLTGGRTLVVALVDTEKNILELVHPRVGEQQRGVVRRDQRRTAHDAVAALGEKSQECLADFITSQSILE